MRLSVVLGTPGVGTGAFAYFECDCFPDRAWPVAEIEYPGKDANGRPVRQRVALEED